MNQKQSKLIGLVNFLVNATEEEFQNIFGDSLGSHFWFKYYNNGKYSYNFINEVSNHNLIILENHLKNEV